MLNPKSEIRNPKKIKNPHNVKILRIIDANLNRTREGLRVCEDILRFTLPGSPVINLLKTYRHSATRSILDSRRLELSGLVDSRDVKKDLSKFNDFKRPGNGDLRAVFMTNIERVKESLRVLEECCKIIDETVSRKYRKLRFKVYEAEKKYNDTVRIREIK